MTKVPFRISAFLAALCATLPAAGQSPAQATAIRLFGSCQDIVRTFPSAPDGTYLLYNNGNLFTAYCYHMSTAPAEYLELARTGQNVNFSQYTAGGGSPGTDVRTRFTRLRIDPGTLTVDIGDLTFASSTGSLRHASTTTVTSMPYAVAMSCTGQANGLGNIDLLGTPLRVDNAFGTGGFNASGSAAVSPDRQVVDLHGGGFCGWEMPVPVRFNPFNPSPGMKNLTLSCARNGVIPARRQLCIHLGRPAATALTAQVQRQGGRPVVVIRHAGRRVAVLDTGGRVRTVA